MRRARREGCVIVGREVLPRDSSVASFFRPGEERGNCFDEMINFFVSPRCV